MKIRMTKVRTTRYRNLEGRMVPKHTPGAQKIVVESEAWYAEWWVVRRSAVNRCPPTKPCRKSC